MGFFPDFRPESEAIRMQTVDYRKGLPAMAACFLIWGFQPLYWYMCTALCGEIDTFFLMACRITWAAVCCLCILKVQGKLPQLWAVFKDKQVLKREIPASVLLFGDWMVYLWAVQNGRVLECSLGYYIQPLVVFALGALIFKEKMSWRHLVIIAIVVVGIALSTSGFGGIPYVTIALALMFAVYAAIKKSLTIDSIVSTTSEILMMVPVALLFILLFRMGDNGMGSMTVLKQLLMIGGGVMVFVWKFVIKPMGGVWGIYELLPAFLTSLILIVVVSLLTPAPEQEIVDEFDRVKAIKD